jgi:hypothetical protein
MFVTDRVGKAGRHVDEDVPDIVGATCFQDEDSIGWIFTKAVSQGAAS